MAGESLLVTALWASVPTEQQSCCHQYIGVPMGCCTNSCLQPLHSNHEKSLFCFVLFVSLPLPFAQITHQLTN